MRRIIPILALATLTSCDADAPRASAAPPSVAPPDSPVAATEDTATNTVLFIGTSLTAGYGVGTENAFPARIQELVDSAGLSWRVENAGLSGETSAGGLRRADWLLQHNPDVLVLELGANDGLRGIDPAELERNLDGILTRARTQNPAVRLVILGMEAPPNLGDDYTSRFRRVFADLAQRYDATLVPFFLDGVAGVPSLNIEDGIHPTAEGHRIIASKVWQSLAPVLAESAREQ